MLDLSIPASKFHVDDDSSKTIYLGLIRIRIVNSNRDLKSIKKKVSMFQSVGDLMSCHPNKSGSNTIYISQAMALFSFVYFFIACELIRNVFGD